MNSKKLKGLKKVFLFSFMQEIKQKSYKYSLMALFAISILSMPIMSLISNDSSEEIVHSDISTVTVYDETGLNIDYSDALSGEIYKDVTVKTMEETDYDTKIQQLEELKDSSEVVIKLSYNDAGYYDMMVAKAANSSLLEEDVQQMSEDFKLYFNKERLRALNVTEEQVKYITDSVECRVEYVSEGNEIKEAGPEMNDAEYSIIFALMMLAVIIISFSGQKLASSIVTEKSTRVIEYLIISVKPLPLLVGKALAVMSLVLLQVAGVGLGMLLSGVVNKAISGPEAKSVIDSMPDVMDSLANTSPVVIVLIVLLILFGNILFCTIAGLVAASVSKMEELDEGMKLFQMIAIVGAYLGLALCMVEMTGDTNVMLKNICIFLPISSPFVTPAYLIMGKTSLLYGVISFIILVASSVLMFVFIAKVFSATILYQGKRLKIKEIINIAKNKPVEERQEA